MAAAIDALIVELNARGNIVDGTAEKATRGVGNAAVKTEAQTKGLTNAQKGLADSSGTVSSLMRSQIAQLAGVAGAYLSVSAAIRGMQEAVTVFADFEVRMAAVQAVTQSTTAEMLGMTDVARELGRRTRFSATQSAEGMEFLGRASFSAAQIIEAMPGVLSLAAASATDLGVAADITSNILSGFNLEAIESNRIADVLAQTAASSNTNLAGLGSSFKFVSPIAAAMSIEVESAAAAIGALGNAGIQGGLAGEQLRLALRTLSSPTRDARKALEELQIPLEALDPATNSLIDIFSTLKDANLEAKDAFKVFGSEATPAILALTSQLDSLIELEGGIRSSTGAAQEMSDIMNDSLKGSALELRSVIEGLAIDFGAKMGPSLRAAADDLKRFFSENSSAIAEWGTVIGQAVRGAAAVLIFLGEHFTLVKAAVVALIALQVVRWMATTAAGAELLAIANTNLATAVWAVNSGYLKMVVLDVAAKFALWARGATIFGTALTAAVPWLAAIAAGVLIANEAVKRWSRESTREIARIVEEGKKVLQIVERVDAAIGSQNLNVMGREIDALDKEMQQLQKTDKNLRAQLKDVTPIDATAASFRAAGFGNQEAEATFRSLKEEIASVGIQMEVNEFKAKELTDVYVLWALEAEKSNQSVEGTETGVRGLTSAMKDLEVQVIRQESVLRVMRQFGIDADRAANAVDTLTQAQRNAGANAIQAASAVRALLDLPESSTVTTVIELVNRLADAETQTEAVNDQLEDLQEHLTNLRTLVAIESIPLPELDFPEIELGDVPLDDLLPTQAELNRLTRDYEQQIRAANRAQQEHNREVAKTQDSWIDLASAVVGALSGLDDGLSAVLESALNVAAALTAAFQSQQNGQDIGGAAVAGLQTGQAVAGLGQSLGLTSPRGRQSGFGGELEGDFGAEGGAIGGVIGGIIGSYFGPAGTAVGALLGSAIGTILGSFITSGADEALSTLEQVGDEIRVRVTKAEGNLRPAIEELSTTVVDIISGLEDAIGTTITTGVFGFKIRDEEISVFINGLTARFTEMSDAIEFAVEEVLRTAQFGPGLGDNVRQVLESGAFDDLDQLSAGIDLGELLDRETASARPLLDVMQEISIQRAREVRLAKQFGLALGSVLALTNERIALARREVTQTLNQMLGVKDYLGVAQAFENAVNDYNTGLQKEHESRQANIASLTAENSAHTANLAAVEAEIEAMGGMQAVLQLVGAERREQIAIMHELGQDGFEAAETSAEQLLRRLEDAQAGMAGTAEEIAALEESLANLPESIDTQAIADAFTISAAQAGIDLIGTLRQVQGEQFMVAEMQELQTKLYILQLAAQIASVEALLAATTLLDAATRELLSGIVDAANEVLEGLIDGSLSLNFGAGGGGRSSRQERQRERDEVIRNIVELELLAGGMSQSTLDLVRSFEKFDEWIARARELNVAEETLAQTRRNNLDLRERDVLGEAMDTILRDGESAFETGFRQLAESFQERFEQIFIIASQRAALNGTSIEEEFRPMADILSDAFSIETIRGFRDEMGRLIDVGDIGGLAEMADLLAELPNRDDLPQGIQEAIASMGPELQELLEEIFSALGDFGFGDATSEQLSAVQTLAEFISELSQANDLPGLRQLRDAIEMLDGFTIGFPGLPDGSEGIFPDGLDIPLGELLSPEVLQAISDLTGVDFSNLQFPEEIQEALLSLGDQAPAVLDLITEAIEQLEERGLRQLQQAVRDLVKEGDLSGLEDLRIALAQIQSGEIDPDTLAGLPEDLQEILTNLGPGAADSLALVEDAIAGLEDRAIRFIERTAESLATDFDGVGLRELESVLATFAATGEFDTAALAMLPQEIQDMLLQLGDGTLEALDVVRAAIASMVGELDDSIEPLFDVASNVGPFRIELRKLTAQFEELESQTRSVFAETGQLSARLADLTRLQRSATVGLGVDFIGSLLDLGVVTPELAALQDHLRIAQLTLARATAVADLIALHAAGSFDLMGLSLQDMLRIVNDAFDMAIAMPTQVAGATTTTGGQAGSTTSEIDALAAALEAVRKQTEDWLNAGIDPLDAQLKSLVDRFAALRDQLLAAGGTLADLADLEEALNIARQAAFDAVLENVRNFLDESERGNPGLKTEDRLEVLQSQFQAAMADALANPGQESIGNVLGLAQELQGFGSEIFTGSALEDFIRTIQGQVGTLLRLEPPDAQIPPAEEILDVVNTNLPGISKELVQHSSILESSLGALLEQNPILAAILGLNAEQIPIFAELLGLSSDQLIGILAQNPILGQILGESQEQIPMLLELLGVSGEQLLALLAQAPLLSELLLAQSEALPIFAEMLGVSSEHLLELLSTNEGLIQLLALQGEQFPLLAEMLGVSKAQLLELVNQSPLLGQLLALQGDQLPGLAALLGSSLEELVEIVQTNPVLGQILAGIGNQTPLLAAMLEINADQLLAFLEQNPILAEQVAALIATGNLTEEGLGALLAGLQNQTPAVSGPTLVSILEESAQQGLTLLESRDLLMTLSLRQSDSLALGMDALALHHDALEMWRGQMPLTEDLAANISQYLPTIAGHLGTSIDQGAESRDTTHRTLGLLTGIKDAVDRLGENQAQNVGSLEDEINELRGEMAELRSSTDLLNTAVTDNTDAIDAEAAGGS